MHVRAQQNILLLVFLPSFDVLPGLKPGIPVYRMVNALSSRPQLTDEPKATAK